MTTQSFSVLAAAAVMTACASTPGPRPAAAPAAPPANLTRVYFYPTNGQSDAQQDRDRYECHNWSVRETSFDPSRQLPPGGLRASVVPARSTEQTVGAAAAVGAVIGAIAADRGDTVQGAVVGGIAGAALGSVAASAEKNDSRRVERQPTRGYGRYEREAAEFRRAMSACLEGRGYSVK